MLFTRLDQRSYLPFLDAIFTITRTPLDIGPGERDPERGEITWPGMISYSSAGDVKLTGRVTVALTRARRS